MSQYPNMDNVNMGDSAMSNAQTEHATPHNTAAPSGRKSKRVRTRNAKSGKKTAELQSSPRIPRMRGSFQRIAFHYGYATFLQRYNTLNKETNRAVIEEEWAKLIKTKWMDWEKEMPEEERRTALDRALSQIGGSEVFDVERYWGNVNILREDAKDVSVIHGETGLKLPGYREGFRFIAFKLEYKGYLKDIDRLNGPVLEPSKAEAAWKYLINAKWNSWASYLPLADKEVELQKALDQVKGHPGFYLGQIDTYWRLKIEFFSKPENKTSVRQFHKLKSLEDKTEPYNEPSLLNVANMLQSTAKKSGWSRKDRKKARKEARKEARKAAKSKAYSDGMEKDGGRDEVETTSVFDFSNLAQALPWMKP